jgi:DNA-binding transcriptional ArsR family regulator
VSALLKALSTPRRREILRLVWNDERSAGDIHREMTDVTFGAVSQHLRVLADAGLVAQRSQGRNRFYSARKRALGGLRAWLESQWDSALDRLQIEAELEAARRGPRAGATAAGARRSDTAARRDRRKSAAARSSIRGPAGSKSDVRTTRSRKSAPSGNSPSPKNSSNAIRKPRDRR